MEKITRKRFDYFLNVLPPLVMGKFEVICFLKEFDLNPIHKELNDFKDLFVQGEGWDKHNIYGVKKGEYFKIGTTLKEWDAEYFRYDDSSINMSLKIQNKLNKIEPINNEVF